MKPVADIKAIRDSIIEDVKAKADAMAKAAVRAEAEAMYKLAKNGMKREEIAALFECGVATVHRRIRLHTEENNIARGAGGKIRREHSELVKEPAKEKVEEKQDCPKDNKHEVAELQDEHNSEPKVLREAHKEEILLALPAPLYKAPDKAIIAKGWKARKEYGEYREKREYRKWCADHKDQHEAVNYFRLLRKREEVKGIIDMNKMIDVNMQCELIGKLKSEQEAINIKRCAPKFNIRFHR